MDHDKVIVSHRAALVAKYGAGGVARIEAAVKRWVAADAKRGIASRLLYLDDRAAMSALGGTAVRTPSSPRETKDAIDAIFRKASPDYLVILGAPDVVPHQDLRNPIPDRADDPDPFAFGDLPYACDAPYSRDVARFKGPTRVVGRLPDLTGARKPVHLLKLLAAATSYRPLPVTDYGKCFGLSALEWEQSTELSLFNMFSGSAEMLRSPPAGPKHSKAALAARIHFINCHGAESDPRFYGQDGERFPAALSSLDLAGLIQPGTVAAVECCYGAQLYDSETLALPLPICQRYLAEGAYGYFGSSTIAYGPAEGNGAADLITQYFLLAVLGGASLGRAALTARQQYVQQVSELDPVDLKTLAQFHLLGDPSLHPASSANATSVPKGVGIQEAASLERKNRRAKLADVGAYLQKTAVTASKRLEHARPTGTVKAALANIARKAGLPPTMSFATFGLNGGRGSSRRVPGKGAGGGVRYHVGISRGPANPGAPRPEATAVVAREMDGRVVGYRIYLQR